MEKVISDPKLFQKCQKQPQSLANHTNLFKKITQRKKKHIRLRGFVTLRQNKDEKTNFDDKLCVF